MKTIIISIILLTASHVFGQSVVFDYDLSGNRTERVIKMSKSEEKSNENDSIPPPKSLPIEYFDHIADTEITIYPNPTQGRLTVKVANMPQETKGQIAIYDLNGRLVLRKDAMTSSNELDISVQPDGAYVMKIILGQESTSWKIIKR